MLLDGLDGPNGLDFWNGYLYVAEEGKVGRVQFDDAAGKIVGKYEIVIDGLPTGGNHWKKTIRFGPDGLLYLNIGSSCNVCLEEDDRRAAMLRYTPDGKFVDIYATGLRNSAGFDWRADGTLYATDNGRDLLGDDFPPCELDQIRQGGFYGWPFANGDRVPDPDLGSGREAVIDASIPPVFSFRAHNAPLGMAFLRSGNQVEEFRGDALRRAAWIVESQQERRLQGRGAALERRRFDQLARLPDRISNRRGRDRSSGRTDRSGGWNDLTCRTIMRTRCIGSFRAAPNARKSAAALHAHRVPRPPATGD